MRVVIQVRSAPMMSRMIVAIKGAGSAIPWVEKKVKDPSCPTVTLSLVVLVLTKDLINRRQFQHIDDRVVDQESAEITAHFIDILGGEYSAEDVVLLT